PQGVRAQGQIQLSQTIPLALGGIEGVLPGPLRARFAWTGSRLEVASAEAPGLYASGGANIDFPPGGGGPVFSTMDFATRLTNFNLASAYTLLGGPAWLRPRGYLDFTGHLQGDWPQPQLAGTAALRQLALNDHRLLADVSGPVQASPAQGAQLDLRGGGSQVFASLGPDLRPQAFRVTNGEFLAQGQPQGKDLVVELRRFDLGLLALRPIAQPDLGWLGGRLEADALINLNPWSNPAMTASFRLNRPSLGAIAAQSLTGQLGYRDGLALLTGGALTLTPRTNFLFTGEGQWFPQWRARAEISTDNAQFQDILQTLGLYDYGDLGRLLQPRPPGQATDLTVHSVGDPEAPLPNQATLARALGALGRLRQQQSARALLPSLEELEGAVSGRLSLTIAQGQDLAAEFSFAGQNWAWGRYDFDNRFLALGQLRDQVLSLNPLEFRAGETRLGLVGDLGLAQSDLGLEAVNLPLSAAANLLETPFQVTGLLNLQAQLTGAYTNPQLQGQFGVAGAMINQQPLQEIGSRFSYQDATLNLQGRILGSSPEPLTFSGQIPYPLPFMTVQPPSQAIALRASLKDEGFSLINLFTPLVIWGGGQAHLDVAIGGSLSRPLVEGAIAFNQARFHSPLLNTSLDHLTGAIQLQDQGIKINSLIGNLFEGQIALSGDLPLTSQAARPPDQGLTLALEDLNFNFAEEVSSHIDGQITLTNALLSPTIGGDLRLQDTQVAVGPEILNLVNTVLLNPGIKALRQDLAAVREIFPVQVDTLRITLLPARVKAAPLFSLGLQGQLALSGSVPGLYGDGAIALTEGWINTVTAEFFLEEGRDNLIVFRPESKLDPELDLRFIATVPLQRRYNINRSQALTARAEIPDIDPLGANTIFDDLLIEARVAGPASRLFENLELSSNPPYSQNQLLSMVTGGYLSDLGGAEPALPLGINLLNAFTADRQDALGNALGLRRFRLTTTSLIPDTEGDRLSLGVGANLGITENLSVSLIQVLNQAQPFAFNARYRIDQNWGIQGSTNFGDNSRLFLEYRLNFR
ncbi:MAG: translocation/assembly module TamB domain-containing protein, partial [Nodosilinea sp.]